PRGRRASTFGRLAADADDGAQLRLRRVRAVPPLARLGIGEREDHLRVLRGEVHAAVAPRRPEPIVPEGRVDRVRALEVLDVRDVVDGVRAVDGRVAVHRVGEVLGADAEDARGGAMIALRVAFLEDAAGRDERGVDG